jgi:hypothetical protein
VRDCVSPQPGSTQKDCKERGHFSSPDQPNGRSRLGAFFHFIQKKQIEKEYTNKKLLKAAKTENWPVQKGQFKKSELS